MNRPLIEKSFLRLGLVVLLLCLGGAAQAQRIEQSTNDDLLAKPNTRLTNDQLASRFLDQTTPGATPEEITTLSAAIDKNADTAFSDWLNAQYALPVKDEDLSLNIFHTAFPPDYPKSGYRQHGNEARMLRGSLMISDNTNELRRLIAYVLSQIFVVSDEENDLRDYPEGMCDWYDMLYRNAFTDFTTILKDVTYHPAMSQFLTYEGNAKAGFYNAGSRPDENYAREVMQLFTIGLVQLNPDGSMVLDASGHPIPTYSQGEITEVARVFTGLRFPKGMVESFGKGADGKQIELERGQLRYGRDVIEEKRHDTGEKKFLGTTLPGGQETEKDIDATLALLCHHPNTAPFFAKAMIQHLVTSNPTPAYVQRVTQAFLRSQGDMKTVISAIFLDDEARDVSRAVSRDDVGRLREPWLRVTQMARAFHAKPAEAQPFYRVHSYEMIHRLGQFPLAAPSVFNFFLPNYQSPGAVSERNANAMDSTTLLVDPEFQIVNSNTALLTPNYLFDSLNNNPEHPNDRLLMLDFTPQLKLANDGAALVENVNTLLAAGMMSDRTKDIVTSAVNKLVPTSEPDVLLERVRMAIYLTLISPDYAIQK